MAAIPLYVAGLLEQTNYWWSKYANFLPILFESTAEEISNRTETCVGNGRVFALWGVFRVITLNVLGLNEIVCGSLPVYLHI
jgi:hypothetical protein